MELPSLAGQLHWTAVKLSSWLRREKPFDISYRTLVRYLHEHHYARRIPRPMPRPPDRDAGLEKRKTSAAELSARVFFGDEAGFEGDPRPRQRKANKFTSCSTTPAGTKAPHSTGTTSSRSIFPRNSPDFNSIKRLWQHLKGQAMAGFLTNDAEGPSGRLERHRCGTSAGH